MTRILNLILIGLLVASAIGVYSIKYESTLQAEQVSKLRRNIDAERHAIQALTAEWAFMSQPERLGELARRHLPDLVPMKVNQMVSAADLPARIREDDQIAEKLEGLGLGTAPVPQVTGSTR